MLPAIFLYFYPFAGHIVVSKYEVISII